MRKVAEEALKNYARVKEAGEIGDVLNYLYAGHDPQELARVRQEAADLIRTKRNIHRKIQAFTQEIAPDMVEKNWARKTYLPAPAGGVLSLNLREGKVPSGFRLNNPGDLRPTVAAETGAELLNKIKRSGIQAGGHVQAPRGIMDLIKRNIKATGNIL